MQVFEAFCGVSKRHAGKFFKKSQFHLPTAKVGLTQLCPSRTQVLHPFFVAQAVTTGLPGWKDA